MRGVARDGAGVKSSSVDELRPAACARCGQPSHLAGGRLGLHGHGTRSRQTRGLLTVDGEAVVKVVTARRYICTRCWTTVTVLPTAVAPHRLYLKSTMAVAFVLHGVERQSQRATRARLCPWRTWGDGSATRWDALRDWLAAVREGRLFRCVRRPPDEWPRRRVAQRAATTVAALAPPEVTPLRLAAFLGAARAA